MKNIFLSLIFAFAVGTLFVPPSCYANDGDEVKETSDESAEDHSVLHNILLYLPNRLFDLMDVFRLRARVGPGLAIGAHVTKVADVFLGSYVSGYAGLPGPRMKHTIPFPLGLESHNGATVSVVDATVDGGVGPNYSPSEIGISLHLGIIGIDLGIDPYEIIDFGTGLIGKDIREDDL